MQKQAVSKYLRISAFKARQVTRLIQGKPVGEAIAFLTNCPRKAAPLVAKTLKSAIANAESDLNTPVSREDLVIKEALVGEGPTMRRFRPKARGQAGRIRHRTSHVTIVVTDEA